MTAHPVPGRLLVPTGRRGPLRPDGRRVPRLLGAAAAVTLALAVAAAVVSPPRTATDVAAGRSAPMGRGAATPPEAFFDLGGATPAAFPSTRLGIAFLALDQPLERAVAVLGAPTSTGPDIGGTASTWALPGGAELTAGAWDGDRLISGLSARVPPGSPARLGAFGGVVVGRSTLREVVAAWGPAYTAATSPFDDYVVTYVECVGPYPVVVKFDQATTTAGSYAPAPGSVLWDRPVTALLVAYADEPPGSAGCPAP